MELGGAIPPDLPMIEAIYIGNGRYILFLKRADGTIETIETSK